MSIDDEDEPGLFQSPQRHTPIPTAAWREVDAKNLEYLGVQLFGGTPGGIQQNATGDGAVDLAQHLGAVAP
ncbi:hypothetical protein OG863_00545 [Streptomyces decoyicus]|uniref:Uncharacterized protein n=1 Tax=Streptomyces decoyicus TaxID=249567 RepID=A0ABZ1F8F4_9ACTN|nr:hypothetical protein [Streptomyces decoyicus]WSB66601.1 hypothetical protein OG863_00545 [Streptomyces decoyicus]